MKKYKCKFCEKEFEFEKSQQFAAHVNNCMLNPDRNKRHKKTSLTLKGRKLNHIEKKERLVECKKCKKEFIVNITDKRFETGKYTKYCCRSCANSRVFSEESNLKKSIRMKGYRFGAITESFKKITKTCPVCKKEFKVFLSSKRIYCSKDCYNGDKKAEFRKKAPGGYRKGSGVCKGGWYKGYWCDSSYELAWIIYNLDHNIKFTRNLEAFDYEFENKKRKYYPDFILEDGSYIEIKGYKTEVTKFKLAVIENIKILYKEDLKDIFEYVVGKYGKDYIRLYEGNPHNQYTNTCEICGKPCKVKSVVCSRICSGKRVNKIKNTF